MIALALSCVESHAAGIRTERAESQTPPSLVLMDYQGLLRTKERLQAGDSLVLANFRILEKAAALALKEGPYSVMDKPFVPSSGNKHDFMSVATYHWPNPDSPDGLPYVRRDGFVAPDWHLYDTVPLVKMTQAVITLSLAHFLSDRKAYADQAARLVNVWFLDEKTRMNPHLNYGQIIRGVNEGRGAGIIDTRGWVYLVDAIGLLSGCHVWSAEQEAEIRGWFHDYLVWLLESSHGQSEAAKKNNHGTWYELQVAVLARFTGENAVAQHFIGRLHNRIAFQIQPDGGQPAELARTRAFHYSVMNLEGLSNAIVLGTQLGFDLSQFRAEDGGGVETALDFLLPYVLEEKKWPYQQVTDWQPDLYLYRLLVRRLSRYYPGFASPELAVRLAPAVRTGEEAVLYFIFQ